MYREKLPCGAVPRVAIALAALAAIVIPATLEAQAPVPGGSAAIASATVFAGGVDLQPSRRHSGGVVTVSGNGLVFQQKIEANRGASIGVFDPEGQLLPDGVYGWELELYPDARTAKRLREAARKNNGRAPGAWQRQTGTFAIRNGLVAEPGLVETRAARRPEGAGPAFPSTVAGPSAARGPAVDDDLAVGASKGVEAAVRAAGLRSTPQAQAGGRSQLDSEAVERSDAAALVTGRSLERRPAAGAAPAPGDAFVESRPVRRSLLDNTDNGANGRDRSSTKQ